MSKRKKRKFEKAAYHEAGHTVAAGLLRVEFRYVSIKEDDDSFGHLLPADEAKSFNPELNTGAATQLKVQNRSMSCLAGPEAQQIFSGRYDHVGARPDYQQAVEWASRVCGGNDEIEVYIKRQRAHIRELLRLNWPAVKALAEALLERETIKG